MVPWINATSSNVLFLQTNDKEQETKNKQTREKSSSESLKHKKTIVWVWLWPGSSAGPYAPTQLCHRLTGGGEEAKYHAPKSLGASARGLLLSEPPHKCSQNALLLEFSGEWPEKQLLSCVLIAVLAPNFPLKAAETPENVARRLYHEEHWLKMHVQAAPWLTCGHFAASAPEKPGNASAYLY